MFSQCSQMFTDMVFVCVFSHSVVFNSAIPWTVALRAPLSIGFSRQEYWSGVPFPPPGDLPDPGIEPCTGRQIPYQLHHLESPCSNEVVCVCVCVCVCVLARVGKESENLNNKLLAITIRNFHFYTLNFEF